MPITPTPPGGSGPAPDTPDMSKSRQQAIKDVVQQELAIKKLIKQLEEEASATILVGDALVKNTKRTEDLKKVLVALDKDFEKHLKQLEREESQLYKNVAAYGKLSKKLEEGAGYTNKLLTSYNQYNLEVQKTIDLSGKFAGATDKGLQAFDKLRGALILTRKEAEAFGKTWSEALRVGFSTEQFERTAKRLQNSFGKAGGIAAMEHVVQAPVGRTTMQRMAGEGPGRATAIGEAIRQASLGGDQATARSLAGLLRAPGTQVRKTEEAIRFEKAGAKAEKFKDDIEAGMAAGLQAGLGPELGALALPMAQINTNVARILQSIVGSRFMDMFKGGGGGAGGVVNKMLGMTGGQVGTGGNFLSKLLGTTLMKGGGTIGGAALKGGIGAGLMLGGSALESYGASAPEGSWKKTAATHGGKAMGIAGSAMSGAAMGSLIGPWGTAIGGALGAIVGVFKKYPVEMGNAMKNTTNFISNSGKYLGNALTGIGTKIIDIGKEWGKKGTKWLSDVDDDLGGYGKAVAKKSGELASAAWGKTKQVAGAVGGFVGQIFQAPKKGEGEQLNAAELMEEYTALATELPRQLDKTIKEIGNTPEMIAKQIAESRLPLALESIDPSRMEDYINKSTVAFTKSVDMVTKDLQKSMADADALVVKAKKAVAEGEKAGLGEDEMEGRRSALSNAQQLQRDVIVKGEQAAGLAEVGKIPQEAIQRAEARQGQVSTEQATAKAEFERQFAGAGNIEEIVKLQKQINQGYEVVLGEIDKEADWARKDLDAKRESYARMLQAAKGNEVQTKIAKDGLDEVRKASDVLERTVASKQASVELEKQNTKVESLRNQVLATEQSILSQRGQRQLALSKAEEEYARMGGAGPEQIGGIARKGAAAAQTQLEEFSKGFGDAMKAAQEMANDEKGTVASRKKGEEEIFNLTQRKVELEAQSLQSRIHAATAEEKQRQELIGVSKRVADIQRDTAAKMGMSWQVQMKYQSESIKLSRAEIDSMTTEIVKMTEEISSTPGGDPEKQLQLQQRKADLAQKQADMIGNVLGKQRTFMESQIANAFGIGGGTKVSPLVNQRLFGPQVQNQLGQRQAVGVGGVMTFEQQQAQRLRDAGMGIMGGIGGGVPGPGNAPGLPPGVALPGQKKPGAAAGGAAGAQRRQQGAGGLDISGKIEIGLNDNLLETRVIRIVQRNFGLPGGNA